MVFSVIYIVLSIGFLFPARHNVAALWRTVTRGRRPLLQLPPPADPLLFHALRRLPPSRRHIALDAIVLQDNIPYRIQP